MTDIVERLKDAEAATHALFDHIFQHAREEIERLRSKIDAMEKQEPVAKVHIHQTGGNAGISWSARPLNDFDALPLLREGDRLYLAPGAKGEEK